MKHYVHCVCEMKEFPYVKFCVFRICFVLSGFIILLAQSAFQREFNFKVLISIVSKKGQCREVGGH